MTTLTYMPPYIHCADGKKKTYFRAPTVADYRAFCGMSPDMEEHVATEYLNNQQDKENHPKDYWDAALWTASDRRTALYWLYIHTRTDTVITQLYNCTHCKQQHGRQLDLADLIDGITTAGRELKQPIDLPNKGKGYIVPLRGVAMQHVELIRNNRDAIDDDQAWSVANMDLRMYEIAHCIRFSIEDEEISEEDRAEARYNYLLTLDAEKEFKPLAAAVKLTLEQMHHGLASVYFEGAVNLITPIHLCPVKEEEASQRRAELSSENVPVEEWPQEILEGNTAFMRLLLPFRCHHFFPAI